MSNVSQEFGHNHHGEPHSAEELLPLVYAELRNLAAQKMARERPGQTLQPTALVHEAYLRLAGSKSPENWAGRTHFFGAAAEAMRRILVESARRKKQLKRGGQFERMELDEVALALPLPNDELLLLDESLQRLAAIDSRAAEVVKLCFFVGLTQPEASQQLGLSLATVERLWSFARAWLFREMERSREGRT